MHWSIFLGLAVIAYAVYILARHIRGMCRGNCGSCPYNAGCDKKNK